MIRFVRPCEKYLKSYTEAYDAYMEIGAGAYWMTDPRACNVFEKYENYRLEKNLKPNRVGADYYWLVEDEGNSFIGEITIRHRLNDELLLRGGHIGYVIRPDEWGRGYGTIMLMRALEKAKERGLERVLITCDDHNVASARVMEHNGCVLEDKVITEGCLIRRYWKTL